METKTEEIKRGDVFKYHKGGKFGVTKIENDYVYYIDLETGESLKRHYDEFIGYNGVGDKRFRFVEHISL